MEEIWKPVVGYEGFYEVSNLGNVRSVDRVITKSNGSTVFYNGANKAKTYNTDKYFTVKLSKNGKYERIGIHILVAKAFLDNPDNLPEVNHIDFNRENNCVWNLEWISHKDNVLHSRKAGRYPDVSGERNPNFGNTKLHEFFKAHPEATARQARKGAQNGRCVPILMTDMLGNETKFAYIRECARFLIDNNISDSKNINTVAYEIKIAASNHLKYANCNFALI